MHPEIEEKIKSRAEGLFSRGVTNMGDALGIEFEKISTREMRAVMPVNENTVQPFGILHGGASVALAETLASVGAYLSLEGENQTAVGLEINANHIRPVKSGNRVRGIARPLHKGAKTQVWEIRIETESGKLVSISRCTLAVVEIKNRG
jgi:1,4-dihydroxy-2-naphthoyl-CoA hydrolase